MLLIGKIFDKLKTQAEYFSLVLVNVVYFRKIGKNIRSYQNITAVIGQKFIGQYRLQHTLTFTKFIILRYFCLY